MPPGTVVEDAERGVRWDLTRARPARRGGARAARAGAATSASPRSTRQAPRFAERGLPGEEGWLELRLKLLADVGLVGLPNAGKSSLLARLTRAAPKVADYPFTTLEPVLGTLEAGERQLVIADIPGLIEGASEGAGLGHEFLAHVERCRLLVHVLDLAPLDGSDPGRELRHRRGASCARHGAGLAALPRMLGLSKADLVPAEEARGGRGATWRERLGDGVLACSSPRRPPGAGLDELDGRDRRAALPEDRAGRGAGRRGRAPGLPAGRRRRLRGGAHAATRAFRVTGRGGGAADRPPRPGATRRRCAYVEERLRAMGVISALEAAGFEPGDDVEIAGTVFELDPGAPLRDGRHALC